MSAIEDSAKEINAEQLGVKKEGIVNNAASVNDLCADSRDTVELVMTLEEEFDTEISNEEAKKSPLHRQQLTLFRQASSKRTFLGGH